MARIKLTLPESFSFSASIPVRITDLNYGGHVGNDAILSLLHEARVQYLQSLHFTELDFAGTSLIMSDVAIEFKNELFYGSELKVYVTAGDFTKAGFDLYYELLIDRDGKEVTIAVAKTGMVCFNYTTRKVSPIPPEALQVLRQD
jgi:acyl-CoA thioester hydrolase